MKKYLILGVAFIFLCVLLITNNKSYSYEDCNYTKIKLSVVNTINLVDYLKVMNYKEVYSFCSYNKCYVLRESDYNLSINNFKKIYDKTLNEDEFYEVYVKGYPITELIVNNC